MKITLLLQERRVLAIFSRLRAIASQVHDVERGRMGTSHEPHKIGCRK